MIKRILCTISAVSLFFITFAYSETKKITCTIMDDGKDICFSTSLIPGRKIPVIHPEETDSESVFGLLKPGLFPGLIRCFAESVTEWNKEKAITQKGFYVGDLFEQSTEKEILELNAEEMEILIDDIADRFGDAGAADTEKSSVAGGLAGILKQSVRKVSDNETTARICTFDTDRYITVSICNGQETILSLSADLSEKDTVRLLTGRGTGEGLFYEEISCKSIETETDYVISLYRTEASSFRMIKEQDCLQSSELRFKKAEGNDFEMKGEIQSVLFPSTLQINGNKRTDVNGKSEIYAELTAEGEETDIGEVLTTVLYSILQS